MCPRISSSDSTSARSARPRIIFPNSTALRDDCDAAAGQRGAWRLIPNTTDRRSTLREAVCRPPTAVRSPPSDETSTPIAPFPKGFGTCPEGIQNVLSHSPVPPHSLSPTPTRFKETRLLPMRLQIVPATDRGGDRAALGRAGPRGPNFPSPLTQTAGIGSFSTDESQKGMSVRAWHSSCDPRGLHMRTMHCATAETGFRFGRRSPRCAFCKSFF